jgi:hypothetical protein
MQSTAVPETSNNEAIDAGRWLNPWDDSRLRQKPQTIQQERIFVVPDRFRGEAIALLESQPAVAISQEEYSHLLGVQHPPFGDEIVDEIIKNAERETKIPGGLAADENITYARALYGKLRPYLVRAVAANSGGKEFGAAFLGTQLYVMNFSLGEFHYERKPVIIFLENRPEAVWIVARSAK